jgi:hypothetical protein
MRLLIEEGLTQAERGLNILGCVPVAAVFSGALRIVVAKVQFLAGAIFAITSMLPYFNHSCDVGVEYMVHGSLNFGRGLAEMLLGLTIIGTAVPLICQLIADPTFKPRFEYTTQRRYQAL